MKKVLIIISIVLVFAFLLGWFVKIPVENEKTYNCIQWELGNTKSLKNVTVTLKRIEYLSLFKKNEKTVSVSINGNPFSAEAPIEDFSSDSKCNYEIAYIPRLPLSKDSKDVTCMHWPYISFLNNDIFNLSTNGEITSWDGERIIKNKSSIKNVGNGAYKNAVNITTAKSKKDIINIMGKFSEKLEDYEKLDENLNIVY